MFTAVSTVSFSDGRPPVVKAWTDLGKAHVVEHLEANAISVLSKMNKMATDIAKGKVPKPAVSQAVPVTVKWDTSVTEDGMPWASMVCTWPKMNPEGIEWFLGLLDGEMSHLPADVKAKHKK